MQIIDQNIHLTSSPVKEALKAELRQAIAQLRDRPSTLGLLILTWLLPQDLTLLESQLEYSVKGHYFWYPLLSNRFCEAGLCFWQSKIANSRKHDHYNSQALVIPLHGTVTHSQYHTSADKFFILERQELQPLQCKLIPGWQIHCCQNRSNDWAISFHFYWWRRPEMALQLADD